MPWPRRSACFPADMVRPAYCIIISIITVSHIIVVNEAVVYSELLKKWVFMPRRISNEPFDENDDSKKGSNTIIL